MGVLKAQKSPRNNRDNVCWIFYSKFSLRHKRVKFLPRSLLMRLKSGTYIRRRFLVNSNPAHILLITHLCVNQLSKYRIPYSWCSIRYCFYWRTGRKIQGQEQCIELRQCATEGMTDLLGQVGYSLRKKRNIRETHGDYRFAPSYRHQALYFCQNRERCFLVFVTEPSMNLDTGWYAWE